MIIFVFFVATVLVLAGLMGCNIVGKSAGKDAGDSALVTSLSLEETAGVNLSGACIRSGIPFAKGLITNSQILALFDGN